MNVMKLLQEVRGFAELTNRRMPARPLGPLLLQFGSARAQASRGRRKWTLNITIQEPPDIPQPVAIRYTDPVIENPLAPSPAGTDFDQTFE